MMIKTKTIKKTLRITKCKKKKQKKTMNIKEKNYFAQQRHAGIL